MVAGPRGATMPNEKGVGIVTSMHLDWMLDIGSSTDAIADVT